MAPKTESTKSNSGFTLIELLVIISVTVLLSGLLIGYTRIGEKQITLITEQAKLIGVILRAKTLTLQAFKEGGVAPCGFGVNFLPSDKYLIFKKPKPQPPAVCDASANKQYNLSNEATEKIQEFDLATEGINISSDYTDIFFLPPDPKVFFDGQELVGAEAIIVLSVGGVSVDVKINKAGQVTTQ